MTAITKNLGFHRISESFLSGSTALFLLIAAFVIEVGGYVLLEGMELLDAIYLVIITFSTVGYGEIVDLTQKGRILTMIYIVINIAIFAYVVAVFGYYIIQGRLFKRLHTLHINRSIKKLNDHVIICGYGRYGLEIVEQLINHKVPFLVIEKSEEVIQSIQESPLDIPYVLGNATNDDVLLESGILRAKSLITALPEDSENLFIILSAKQLNPSLNLISRAHDKTVEQKLKLAGANHVVLPNQIGGFYMATLISKPDTVEFFSFLTNEFESDVGFEEIHQKQLPERCKGMSIAQLNIRRSTGANIIGFRTEKGKYIINPEPDTVMTENSSFIIIGNKEQLQRLKEHLSKYDG